MSTQSVAKCKGDEFMKASIISKKTCNGTLICIYDNGDTVYFDELGRLLNWVGVCDFSRIDLLPEEAGVTYKHFINFWSLHNDPLGRATESHHEIPLYALKGAFGANSTTVIRNTGNDRGNRVDLPVLAHMRAHYYLASHYRDTPYFYDAKSSFDMLAGRQGMDISESAMVELYKMRQLLRQYKPGESERNTIVSFYYQRFTEEDFSNKNLSGTSFHGCIFDKCNFIGADMSNCDLTFTIFRNCNTASVNWANSDVRGMKVLPI